MKFSKDKLRASLLASVAALTLGLSACSPRVENTEEFKKLTPAEQKAIVDAENQVSGVLSLAAKKVEQGELIKQLNY